MPKPTFHNLPSSKRDRLMAAAEEEFATHAYAEANLDRIAGAAGVPKGSLYQYFEGKEDFYHHTVEQALHRAWAYFERHVAKAKPSDCFELLVEAMLHMANLRKDEPHWAALYAKVVFAQDTHARAQLLGVYNKRSDQFYDRLIPWGLEDGLIDPELPQAVVRFHINAVGSHFQYLVLTDERPPWLPEGPLRLRRFARQLVGTLRTALAPQNPAAPTGDSP